MGARCGVGVPASREEIRRLRLVERRGARDRARGRAWNGSTMPALRPVSAGPWKCSPVTDPVRPEKLMVHDSRRVAGIEARPRRCRWPSNCSAGTSLLPLRSPFSVTVWAKRRRRRQNGNAAASTPDNRRFHPSLPTLPRAFRRTRRVTAPTPRCDVHSNPQILQICVGFLNQLAPGVATVRHRRTSTYDIAMQQRRTRGFRLAEQVL